MSATTFPAHGYIPGRTIPPFPAPGFGIGTTYYDGRAYAFAYCKPCHHYGYHIHPCVTSRLGDAFRSIDLAEINRLAEAHQCPDFVQQAAQEHGVKPQ